MWFTDQIAAGNTLTGRQPFDSLVRFHSGELLVEYHKYHSNFEQSVSTSSKRYFIGFQDYGGEGVDVSYADKYLSYRLCYSLHSSFAEVADVLKTLKPKRVTPIATPMTSHVTPKQLFKIIDHYIRDSPTKSITATTQVNEKLQRKPVQQHVQVKHRYDSFQTKAEKKRRKNLLKEEQQTKDNEEALDMDNESEKQLLQRFNSLTERQSKKIKTTPLSIVAIPLDPSDLQDRQSDPPNSSTPDEQPVILPSTESHRERTLSDASSATIDYDFDAETCNALVLASNSTDNAF